MSPGWVKIHRSILGWRWFQDSKTLHVFLYLLLSAAIEDREWRDIKIKRGQVVTSRKQLSEELGISEQSIRTCLGRLENSGEINQQPTNRYTVITICKFDTYQDEKKPAIWKSTSNQPAINQQNESSPHTPLKDNKNTRKIYYYSSAHVCAHDTHTREEKQKQQFFFIFYLKGAEDPLSEAADFVSWNTVPKRASSWDNCPEYARYETARRWKVKGQRLEGYSDRSGKALTEIVDYFIRQYPDFLDGIYCRNRYPCVLTGEGDGIAIYCDERTMRRMEGDIGMVRMILGRMGIDKLAYRPRPVENGK